MSHPWQDAEHPSYHRKKTVNCLGCGERCSRSAWGRWCYKCNVARMTRINRGMAQLAESYGLDFPEFDEFKKR